MAHNMYVIRSHISPSRKLEYHSSLGCISLGSVSFGLAQTMDFSDLLSQLSVEYICTCQLTTTQEQAVCYLNNLTLTRIVALVNQEKPIKRLTGAFLTHCKKLSGIQIVVPSTIPLFLPTDCMYK